MKNQKKKTVESKNNKSMKAIKILWFVGLFPIFAVLVVFLVASLNLPDSKTLQNPPDIQASIIFADNGEEMGRYWKENRVSLNFNEISPYMFSVLIATEDARFYEHSGIDGRALGRAVVFGIMGRNAGGASTISQQLSKLLFSTRSKSKMQRYWQKIKENILATKLERSHTKEEIMTMYLNRMDFLYNAVGIGTAAKVYFDKTASELNMQEAAMLVGMLKNPSLYNPRKYPERAMNRRNTVLEQWVKFSDAKGVSTPLTQQMCDSLKNTPIELDYQVADHKIGVAPYFREVLRKDLNSILKEKDEKGNLKYAKEDGTAYDVYEDGLRVYTTINPEMQKAAEIAVEKHLKEQLQPAFNQNNKSTTNFPFANTIKKDQVDLLMLSARKRSDRYRIGKAQGLTEEEIMKQFDEPMPMNVFSWSGDIDTVMTPNDSIRYYKSFLRAGLVSIEPQTGFVKAWVGGINFEHFAYDQVKQGKRQVGSTIKPFIYSAAIRFGVTTPCSTYPVIRYCIRIPSGNGFRNWCPRGGTGGSLSVKDALAKSSNPITVLMMSKMGATQGPKAVAQLMRDLGIELRQEDINPTMCLGSMDLSLLEMVGAQTAFVNKGLFTKPIYILRIEDRFGKVIYEPEPETKEAMSEDLAYTTITMMKGAVQKGTATSLRGGAKWGGITYPTGGKTGTTQNNSDGWFMALTPDLVTGVWVGAEDRAVRFRSMAWGQGAKMALPIYGYYMQQIYKSPNIKISKGDFEGPEGYDECKYNVFCKNSEYNDTGDIKRELEDDFDNPIPF
jgi:penicillin-binding protein 1A